MRLMRDLVARVQRLPVGGAHAARRGGDAPAQALPRPQARSAAMAAMSHALRTHGATAALRAPAATGAAPRLRAVPRHRRHAGRARDGARCGARSTRRLASAAAAHRAPSLGGALALVTGRAITSADRLFPGPRAADGRTARLRAPRRAAAPSTCTRRVKATQAHAAQAPARTRRGIRELLLEDKGATLALHYRAAPQLASHVHQHAARARRCSGTTATSCSPARCCSRSSRRDATRARRSTTS